MSVLILALLLNPVYAFAEAPSPPSIVRVIGRGSVRTPPDLAVIGFSVRGEGRSSDEAVQALTDRQARIEAVTKGVAEVRTGTLSIAAVRDPGCTVGDQDEDRPRLSSGPCTITGYVAELGVTARTAQVADAGTLLATISQLGATEPSLREFGLTRPAVAHDAAMAAAVDDARRQAQAAATAARLTLGPIRRVEDQRAFRSSDAEDILVTGKVATRTAVRRDPVRLSPAPIETEASVVVEFALVDARS